MRALIARDLADAGIVGLSADRRFATAYNAALQAATACRPRRIPSEWPRHSGTIYQVWPSRPHFLRESLPTPNNP
jgi:hypothetical protein